MKAIVLMADTTIRSCLRFYGGTRALTPNLERLAARSTVFDGHWCGSAPCVPARRDMFTGRLNFLERNWGGAEPFDHLLCRLLRDERDTYCHLVTDHTFYFTPGGENYPFSFNSWELFRGQEHDPLNPLVKKVEVPEHHGLLSEQYYKNRQLFQKEADYPSPKTYQSAADWLERNHEEDNFFLWVESFDPHEPFDTPKDFLDLYGDDYEGIPYFWPHYAPCDDTPEQLRHIRNCYLAALTMMDKWLGKVLDVLDRHDMWKDTMVIFTTDHGFMLGEHGFMAKNYMPAYNEVFHIPLLIAHPDIPGGNRISALTQNIDLFPTIAEYFGVGAEHFKNPIHGKSLLPLLRGETDKLRDAVLYGYYGLSVNMTDGKYTYLRAAAEEDNTPLYLYTAMPATLRQYFGLDSMTDFSGIEMGRFLKWTDYPVFKIPSKDVDFQNPSQSFRRRSRFNAESMLFDIENDYAQEHPIQDAALLERYSALLKELMLRHDTPEEQFIRLGL